MVDRYGLSRRMCDHSVENRSCAVTTNKYEKRTNVPINVA